MGSGSGVDKLSDTSHFPDWATQMEALLEEKELWDTVIGNDPIPATGPNLKPMKSYRNLQRQRSFFTLTTPNFPMPVLTLQRRFGTISITFIVLVVSAPDSFPAAMEHRNEYESLS